MHAGWADGQVNTGRDKECGGQNGNARNFLIADSPYANRDEHKHTGEAQRDRWPRQHIGGNVNRKHDRRSGEHQAIMSFTTLPWTSVSRKSRPWWRDVSRSWSSPNRWRMVAFKSCTCTGFSTIFKPKSSVLP